MIQKAKYEELEQRLNSMETGAHLCFMYQTDEEHKALLTLFMGQGLERNEKVIYIADLRTADEIIDYLRDDGLAVESLLENGQLCILAVDETYMRKGVFDPDGMINMLHDEINRALDEGYSALRVTGEMSWVLKEPAGSECLFEYEAKLNDFIPGSKCLAICQYDRRRFDPVLLLDVIATHPVIIVGTEIFDNFYYMPVKDFLSPNFAAAKFKICLDNLVEHKQSKERITHLNSVLNAIRKVNQLIVMENDRDRFILAVCNALIETRGYHNAWIAIFDESRNLVATAEAGLDKEFQPMSELLKRGELTDCARKALAQSDIVVIEDPLLACADCPLAGKYAQRGGVTRRLEYQEKVYGVLTVSIPRHFINDEEEHALFNEVCKDISFALQKIELAEEYHRTNGELRESKEKYRTVLEVNPDPVVLYDTEGRVTYINPAFEQKFGWSFDELAGKRMDFVPEENWPETKDAIKKMLNGAKIHSFETRRLTKKGKILDVQISSSIFFNRDGEGQGSIVTLRDITERKKSEQDLSIRNQIAEILLTTPDDEMYGEVLEVLLHTMESKHGVFGYIDEKGAMICPSMTRDIWEQCQVQDKDIVFPRDRWGGIWERALIEKKAIYSNKDFQVPEGHVPINSVLCVPIIHGNTLIGLFMTGNKEGGYGENDKELLENIASYIAPVLHARLGRDRQEKQRKEAEEKIKGYSEKMEREVKIRTDELRRALWDTEESRDKIDGILKSVPGGIIVTDIYNRIILMNRAAEDLLGVRLSEVVNRSIDVAVKDETLLARLKDTLDKKEAGAYFDFEVPMENTKYPRIMRARTSIIQDKTGKLTGVITLLLDITHEHEVDRLKTEFISIAAHELRTPLTSIQGFSEILLTRDNINEQEKKKFLSYINRQSMCLAGIINSLLDISRIESGRGLDLNKAPCNMNEIIREMADYYRASSPKHQFDIILPEGSVDLVVDRERMRQVLENMLSNAVKYSPGGGLIRVTGELKEDHFQVSVEDHGVGIYSDHVERVFDEFYRVDDSRQAIPGTGLGLSIVKTYVTAHGGRTWIESEPGKGTTVIFTLPVK